MNFSHWICIYASHKFNFKLFIGMRHSGGGFYSNFLSQRRSPFYSLSNPIYIYVVNEFSRSHSASAYCWIYPSAATPFVSSSSLHCFPFLYLFHKLKYEAEMNISSHFKSNPWQIFNFTLSPIGRQWVNIRRDLLLSRPIDKLMKLMMSGENI